jgi:tape measure domain-containing protein
VADLRKTIEILFEGNDQASRKAADVIGKLNEMKAQATTASEGTDKLENSLDRVGKTSTGLGLVNTALVTLAGSLAFKAFIDANVSIQQFELGLKAVGGASVNTTQELSYVRDVASRLGLELGSTANAYLQLTAATKGTQLEGAATRSIFEAVSAAMSAVGKSGAETEGALKAIEQIASKGKVQMEELRGQLGDRLPGALQIAARAMGVTTVEFEGLVKSGLSAETFLPRFAAELNKTFAGASFDGYAQQMNRLRSSIDELLVQIGKAGVFDTLTGGVGVATNTVKGLGIEFTDIGSRYDIVARAIRTGDFSNLAEDFKQAGYRAEQLKAELADKLNPSLNETVNLSTRAAEALERQFRSDQTDAETSRLLRYEDQAKKSAQATSELDKLLKSLGVDPKKTDDGIAKLAQDLEALATNPKTNGDLFVQGFEAALKRVSSTSQLDILASKLDVLFKDGKISAAAYDQALESLEKTSNKLNGTQTKTKDAAAEAEKALAKQAAETRKAEEAAAKYALELEKLASNERIKNIEAKVTLNVADIEAQTKRVEAAFESINTTVDSTGDLLSTLFGALKDYDTLSFRASNLLEKQIDLENQRRQEALDLQKKLVEAQIGQLKAQTRALDKGDSLIKVDGAGLQPHLEAFMWEILRTIQIRANEDGLGLLLGQ